MIFENLTSENVLLYLAKAYDKPDLLMSEFEHDLARFHYIKRILKRYQKTSEINVNLLLNHIIILCNVFGPEVTVRVLFFKFTEKDFVVLKTILVFLDIMPNVIHGIRGLNIISSDIGLDSFIVDKLRKLQ